MNKRIVTRAALAALIAATQMANTIYIPIVTKGTPHPTYHFEPGPGTYELMHTAEIDISVGGVRCNHMWIEPLEPYPGAWSDFDEAPYEPGFAYCSNPHMHLQITQAIHFDKLRITFEGDDYTITHEDVDASYTFE